MQDAIAVHAHRMQYDISGGGGEEATKGDSSPEEGSSLEEDSPPKEEAGKTAGPGGSPGEEDSVTVAGGEADEGSHAIGSLGRIGVAGRKVDALGVVLLQLLGEVNGGR
jgi:hypothetical protein